jgi:hypothetical protein
VNGESKEGRIEMKFLYSYKNKTMRPVAIVLRRREGMRMMEGVNVTKLHCKHIWKCHNETPCTTMLIKMFLK